MKTFSFPLESLLLFRTQAKERAFEKWAKAVREFKRVVSENEKLQADLKAWAEARREQQKQQVPAGELNRSYRVEQEIFANWVAHKKLQKILETRMQLALKEYQEARQNQEILERLKQRFWVNWVKDYERQEQKLNDERATLLAFQEKRPGQLLISRS